MLMICSAITGLSVCVMLYCVKNKIKEDKQTKELNRQIQDENAALNSTLTALTHRLCELKEEYQETQNQKKQITADIQQLTESFQDSQNRLQAMSAQAFETHCDLLDKKYEETEEEYDELISNLQQAYANQQMNLLQEMNKYYAELDKIKATRAAAIAAQLNEEKVKANIKQYCLQVPANELSDIQKLETVKLTLTNPRVLSMLIWKTYWQKPMNDLCDRILTTTTITGIYKITNVNTGMCYVGQSVDIASRWKSHAKCGLGIDTPTGNKLYKAMQTEGIWNFSWELLEQCSSAELNEKEKFYIDLYQAYHYGYNSNAGISKTN